MTRRSLLLRVLALDLRAWASRGFSRVCVGAILGMVLLSLGTRSAQPSLFVDALGGPSIALSGGQLVAGPGWTWLGTGVLYLVTASVLIDTSAAWTQLIRVRRVTPATWALARLGALAGGALTVMAMVVATLAVVMVVGRSEPLIRVAQLWDVGLWVAGLVSLGWFAQALRLLTRQAWLAFVLPLILLALARFGGNLAPYIPFAQWIVGLHQLPGTLSVGAGAAYVLVWAIVSGAVVLWAARRTPD